MSPVQRYLTEVLGLQSFLRPANGVSEPVSVRAPKLFWVVSQTAAPRDLLEKMTAAMGLAWSDTVVLEAGEEALEAVFDRVVESERAAVAVYLSGESLGQWTEHAGVATVRTHSLAELSRNPNAKKETWQHLKEVMKRL